MILLVFGIILGMLNSLGYAITYGGKIGWIILSFFNGPAGALNAVRFFFQKEYSSAIDFANYINETPKEIFAGIIFAIIYWVITLITFL